MGFNSGFKGLTILGTEREGTLLPYEHGNANAEIQYMIF